METASLILVRDDYVPNRSNSSILAASSRLSSASSTSSNPVITESQFAAQLEQRLAEFASQSRVDPNTEFNRLWQESQRPEVKAKIQEILTNNELDRERKIISIANLLRSI